MRLQLAGKWEKEMIWPEKSNTAQIQRLHDIYKETAKELEKGPGV